PPARHHPRPHSPQLGSEGAARTRPGQDDRLLPDKSHVKGEGGVSCSTEKESSRALSAANAISRSKNWSPDLGCTSATHASHWPVRSCRVVPRTDKPGDAAPAAWFSVYRPAFAG